jgi:hypothetical protein
MCSDLLHHPLHPQSSPPYAKVKVMTSKGLIEVEEEDEEEESHYALIRQPDGQADEARYRYVNKPPPAFNELIKLVINFPRIII